MTFVRSCPDFELDHDARVGALLRDGNGALLDFARQPSLEALNGLQGDRGHERRVSCNP